MRSFYITFGQKYRHEPHPKGGHPDGWFVIEAENAAQAHDLAFEHIGPQWAFCYADDFKPNFYPLGELGRVTATGLQLHATPMNDHNSETLALQREIGKLSANLKVRDEIIRLRDERIGELEAEIVRKDDQMRELQHQLAAAKRDNELEWLEQNPRDCKYMPVSRYWWIDGGSQGETLRGAIRGAMQANERKQ